MCIAVNIFNNVCMCVRARWIERKRWRYLTTAIELFGLSTLSFAISKLLILYERRPGNAVGRVSRLVDVSTILKGKARNMDEELRLSLPAQETSSVPI